ncbi:MAG: YihY family inner membrane protein [Phycisphaerae bacterium]|nr:YihY family inner membrane protein [Phycisphaerae bacterium]
MNSDNAGGVSRSGGGVAGVRAPVGVGWRSGSIPSQRSRWRIAWDVITETYNSVTFGDLPLMSAALTYRTIFSLLPLLVVALVTFRMFKGTDQVVADLLRKVLDLVGLGQIAVTQGVGPPGPDGSPPPIPGGQSIADWIQGLVNKVSEINFGAIGVVGLAMLVYACISMLVEVERSFNQIYAAPRGRSWLRRVQQYWLLVSLGPLCLWASFYVGETFRAWVLTVTSDIPGSTNQTFLLVLGYAVTVSISWLLLFTVYMVLPNTKVRMGPAMAGALVGAVLLESGKAAFTLYLHKTTGYVTLYGSLALLPLFLLWVYVTWMIVLLGLQMSFSIQSQAAGHRLRLRESDLDGMVDPSLGLLVLAAVGRTFQNGQAIGAGELAKQTGLREPLVRSLLARFTDQGFVRVVVTEGQTSSAAVSGADEAYTLARPADTIGLAEAMSAMQARAAERAVSPVAASILSRVAAASRASVEGETLAAMLPPPPSAEWTAKEAVNRTPIVESPASESGSARLTMPGTAP